MIYLLRPIQNYAAIGIRDEKVAVLVANGIMYAKEKAKYIFDHGFPVIDNFYSDSLSDTPIALCAEKAHLVSDKARTVVA